VNPIVFIVNFILWCFHYYLTSRGVSVLILVSQFAYFITAFHKFFIQCFWFIFMNWNVKHSYALQPDTSEQDIRQLLVDRRTKPARPLLTSTSIVYVISYIVIFSVLYYMFHRTEKITICPRALFYFTLILSAYLMWASHYLGDAAFRNCLLSRNIRYLKNRYKCK